MSTDIRRLALVRFHDGSVKTNWGGRATSLALLDLLEAVPSASVGGVVNGSFIVRGFEGMLAQGDVAPSDRSPLASRRHEPPRPCPGTSTRIFHVSPRERVRQLIRNRGRLPAFDWIASCFEAADAVVVNGEGDFILRRRPTLWRTLLLMETARRYAGEVHLVNTMLSPDEDGVVDADVTAVIDDVLGSCATVAYRDPESLAWSSKLLPSVSAVYRPDALFTWRPFVAGLLKNLNAGRVFLEVVPPEARATLATPYVVLSGGSARIRVDRREAAARGLEAMIAAIRALGVGVVVVATCDGDRWMLPVARHEGAVVVPPRVPLATSLLLLSRAEALISGRFHPSILAALCGTPSVFMRSNSHKTRSLATMLGMPGEEHLFFDADADPAAVVRDVERLLAWSARQRHQLRRTVGRLAREATLLTGDLATSRP